MIMSRAHACLVVVANGIKYKMIDIDLHWNAQPVDGISGKSIYFHVYHCKNTIKKFLNNTLLLIIIYC